MRRLDSQALATYAFGVATAFLPLIAYRVLMVWVYVNTGSSTLLGWLMHWSLIVGVTIVTTLVTGSDLILANAWFTIGLWVSTLVVIVVFGASTLRGRAGSSPGMTVARRPASG